MKNKMKLLFNILASLFVGGILLSCKTPVEEGHQGMEFDRHLSMTEADVQIKYGEPKQCGIYPVGTFLSELHRPIYRKYSPNRLDTNIMEMCYEINGYQLFLWLENKHRCWRVVGDAKFPKGTRF